MKAKSALISNVPQLILGTIIFLLGWWSLDQFNAGFARGIAFLLVGTLMLNGAVMSITMAKYSQSENRRQREAREPKEIQQGKGLGDNS